MSTQLDALVVQVEANTTVIGSAEALIAGLAVTLADIQAQLAAQNIDNATLNDLQAKLADADAGLAAAIAANTPAEPAPPTP